MRLLVLLAVAAAAASGVAYADGPPELYAGSDDGSPGTVTRSAGGCTVWIEHEYRWDPSDPPRNNAPHEESLYPGDRVRGVFSWGSSGCGCGVSASGPSARGDWSHLSGVSPGGSGASYTQEMLVRPDNPTPDSTTIGGYLQTAEYDKTGRSRTHHPGTSEGHGLTGGAVFSVTGKYWASTKPPTCKAVTAVSHAEFRYRNPFWQTPIYKHHVLDPQGYPASNLDHSTYPHDAIALEAGSNLVLGDHRWETIKITHAILDGGNAVTESVCENANACDVMVPDAPAGAGYIGNQPYEERALSPSWWVHKTGESPARGEPGKLDNGEAIFVIPAKRTGPISIVSTMTNNGQVVGQGYNATWQFVPSYQPMLSWEAVTNTALGGNTALERPVSVVITYNGTISNTLHYCSVGVVYDLDGSVLARGETGGSDAWGREAGAACPEERPDSEWGVQYGQCSGGACTYVVHPDKPAAAGWGRWSAVNPETRALLGGFEGTHTVCPVDPDNPYHGGEMYVFVLDGDNTVVAHNMMPELVGADFGGMLDGRGTNLGGLITAGASPDGAWIEYYQPNPSTGAGASELKLSWIKLHAGHIFGAAFHPGHVGGVSKDADEERHRAMEVVDRAITAFETDRDAALAAITDPAGTLCVEYDTPYLNWDFVPGTDRDFVPACTVDLIAGEGGSLTNQPKPAGWGVVDGWGQGRSFTAGAGAEPHSYRGIFAGSPYDVPQHYVVNSERCEAALGDRECVLRGGECKPEYDRRCESVFEPFLYPDDYIMTGHDSLQEMVVGWCGPSPASACALEAYEVIDEVMVAMCGSYHHVDYDTRGQVADFGVLTKKDGDTFSRYTPHICHNAYATEVFEPALRGGSGEPVADWRECYGGVPPQVEGPPTIWPAGKPDTDPATVCAPAPIVRSPIIPWWDWKAHSVYVPYTPTTGAFGGVVERPGNVLLDDGTLTCSCEDNNSNNICDFSEARVSGGADLDDNRIIDDWDSLTVDGAKKCLDRTGTTAAAVAACWAKYGRNYPVEGAESTAPQLVACLADANGPPDGPDGECNPALILGVIVEDGSVAFDHLADPEGLGRSLAEFVNDPDLAPRLSVPFLGVGEVIPIPYIVDGEHAYCDESEPWCVSSGDTYQQHTHFRVCQDPDLPISVKRIPAPATIPPLHQPVFDEHWPPECLPAYPVGSWSRPDHTISLDLVGLAAEWPTAQPGSDPAARTPSHVSTGGPSTMMLHAGTGVIRFDACVGCSALPTTIGTWEGTVTTTMGLTTEEYNITMRHPPFLVSQQGHARVVAVEPCEGCPDGWRAGISDPGVELVVTAYPVIERPVTKASEMVAHTCQVDGDRGTGPLNIGGPAGAFASWLDGALGVVDAIGVGEVGSAFRDLWFGMSCRDSPGISITIQDYEAARHGPAAKREAGQPWTVAEGVNDVSVEVFRNGLWLNTLSILEHRGQCTSYTWSPDVTAGHTSCPATSQGLVSCLYQGEMRWCMERHTESPTCSNAFVEDGIHKLWEFTGDDVTGRVSSVTDTTACDAAFDAEERCVDRCGDAFVKCATPCGDDRECTKACAQAMDACNTACGKANACVGDTVIEYSGCGPEGCHPGGVPVVYRMADGGYGRSAGPGSPVEELPAERLAWDGTGPSNILLRCEAVLGEDGTVPELLENVPAEELDFNLGGSFACQEVQACKKVVTNYKCLGGKIVENKVCAELEDSFSVLDMPYEEVMASVGPQALHIEATCPADHPHAPGSPGCDGRPIYDTHPVSEGTNSTLVYVDYHGVGELVAGRDDPASRTIHLDPPVTFGGVRWILIEWDGGSEFVRQDSPCTDCVVEYPGQATVTVGNVYGATLTADIGAAEVSVLSRVDVDEVSGVVWLYLPAIVTGLAAYVLIKKFRRQLGIWDEGDDDQPKALDNG